MSKNSQPEREGVDVENIKEAAAAAESSASSASDEDRLATIEDRLASIEPLLEQLQANAALGTSLTDYVKDLRDEQTFFNKARYGVGCASIIVIAGLMYILCLAIFHEKSPLLKAPPLAIVAFVVGLTSGIALLLNSFVKGVFRSTADRHADGFLPPTLQASLEAMNKILGK